MSDRAACTNVPTSPRGGLHLHSRSRRPPHRRLRCVAGAIAVAGVLALLAPPPAPAQSTAEMLEQARARAQEIEDLKRALNSPDQNLRLATFEIMMQSKQDSIRALALATGLASADRLLQALAFRTAVMGLEQIHLTLAVDESQPDEIQESSRARLASLGDQYTINIGHRDPARGIFALSKQYAASGSKYLGEVTGTRLTVVWDGGHTLAELELDGDDAMRGTIRFTRKGVQQFDASARLR